MSVSKVPRALNLLRRVPLHRVRFRHHEPVQPCYQVKHLELDGLAVCPEGRRRQPPGFWKRIRTKCRNLRDHQSGYLLNVECMWCRWLMDDWERKHPGLVESPSPVTVPAADRRELNLYSPTQADLQRDPRHREFLDDLRAEEIQKLQNQETVPA